jgi:hypothetical protein
MNYLVSYNRSGNTWVRYILEYLTHQPTWGHEKFSISERMGQESNITLLSSTEPIVIKRHEIIPNEIKDSDNVIFLLRDYQECIWNSMNCKWEKFKPEFVKYWNLLKFYNDFRGHKILVKYDDLIKNPKTYISILLIFLGFDPFELIFNEDNDFNKFLVDYDTHREKCFSIYKNSINTRNGESLTFTKEEIDYMNNVVKTFPQKY